MWPNRQSDVDRLAKGLARHARLRRPLPGISTSQRREVLAWQMVASLRRLEYTLLLKSRPIHPARVDPNSAMFDPERAAIFHLRCGDLDEAFWITFLSIHFGKHARHGWQRLRDIYSGLGQRPWSWANYSADPIAFRRWLAANETRIGGAFGNHRKYGSIRTDSEQGTDKVLQEYLDWIGPTRSHRQLVTRLVQAGGNDPHTIYDRFYRDMRVRQFGRLGRFDFLALVGRLDLAPITPGSAYLTGATGPRAGARLLYGGTRDAKLRVKDLDLWLVELNQDLCIGMQPIEDSLCNWQKSPDKFIHFKG